MARAFSVRRANLNQRQRIFSAEPAWTLSGAAADVRCTAAPGAIREIARFVANTLGANLGEPRLPDEAADFARDVAGAITGAAGRVLVLVGEGQPAEVHALAHWINERMNAPIEYLVPPDPVALDHAASLRALADDLQNRHIGALVIADANPVYDAPGGLNVVEAMANAAFSVHIGAYRDETAARCQWHLPLSHSLESWGDARAFDGTPSLVQPLIKTLYDTKTVDEVFALLAGAPDARAYDLARATWQASANGNFEDWWRRALHDGVIADSAAQRVTLGARLPDLPFAEKANGYELVLAPDASLWDGRYANNAWLQECPKPFTRQVWGNATQLAPADAKRLGVTDEDVVEITLNGQRVALPAVVTLGQAPGVIVTSAGYGRTSAGQIGNGVGVRIAPSSPRMIGGVLLEKSAQSAPLRSPQLHTRVAGKAEELLRVASVTTLRGTQAEKPALPPSLLPVPAHGVYAWAMVVNTDACIGCNACVVACQAENNVPVVGPSEISQGRDMHWLRVDGYTLTDEAGVRNGFQPVPCMHCELAPCEPVCPVEASVHDHEGLNVQVYNRCIGTRFCQANCPYKVRRFNWFAYAGEQAYAGQETALKAQHNPDVSARGRGVMEKCNYCLQRISRARHAAERDDRRIAEGEVVTACQAACPTRAIHFGDLNQADGVIARLRQLPQHYTLLEELNTRPRTTYLKRIYNDGAAT
jgi:molybdopterin-containing oxidoreductase family iron-sulfur binding subunit